MSNLSGKTALVTGVARDRPRQCPRVRTSIFELTDPPIWCPRTLEPLTRSDGYPAQPMKS